MTETARPGGRALQASEPMGAGRPSVPPLRVERTALITGAVPPHPPQCAHWGTFPWGKAYREEEDLAVTLIRHGFAVPPSPFQGEGLLGGHMRPPLRRKCTRSVGSAEPGAVVEPQQLQFLQPQPPVGRREFRPATQILRAGNSIPSQRDNPRNGVRGKATMSTECSSEPSPGAFWFLCRHGQRNSPPAGGEILPA